MGLVLASVTAMAFADAIIKLSSADLTLWQIFTARSIFALVILIGISAVLGLPLAMARRGWVLARSALLVLTWVIYYTALPHLDLALAAVAITTNPIFTTLLTSVVLGERVTRRQWAGVFLGFAGVAVVLRPFGEPVSAAILLPLVAAVLYSGTVLITRAKLREEPAMGLAISLHGTFLAVGLGAAALLPILPLGDAIRASDPFLLTAWAPMNLGAWALMAGLGVLSAGFFLGIARAYQIAPPQIVATFDYGYVFSAAIWGFVFFHEVPDAATLAGMVLITAAGVVVARPART